MQTHCPTAPLWLGCQCGPPKAGRVIGPSRWGWDEYTYLPGMGVVCVGERLLSVGRWDRERGLHYWQAVIVGRWDENRVLNRELSLVNTGDYHFKLSYMWPAGDTYHPRVCEWMTVFRVRRRRPSVWEWPGRFIMPQLRRIQRAVRGFLARRRWAREARLLVALGMTSPGCGFACLPSEMMARVCAWVV